jgi:hypothetical protein
LRQEATKNTTKHEEHNVVIFMKPLCSLCFLSGLCDLKNRCNQVALAKSKILIGYGKRLYCLN